MRFRKSKLCDMDWADVAKVIGYARIARSKMPNLSGCARKNRPPRNPIATRMVSPGLMKKSNWRRSEGRQSAL